jgi:hypothetical protein
MRWLQAILPKEERFFALFAEHARAVVAGAEALRSALAGGAALAPNLKTVMDCEHEGDRVTRSPSAVRLPQRPARRRQLDRHRRLDPRAAPAIRGAWAAFFNFIAFLFFGLHVARRSARASSRREHRRRPPRVIFGALMGAIVWNLITWAGSASPRELARPDRRPGRRRHRQGRLGAGRDRLERA